MKYNFCVPCLFGVEGLCADELRQLGLCDVRAENGRVLFSGAVSDIARANINLRTGERLLLVIGETSSETFDDLFDGVRAMPWADFIPINGAFPVKGHCLESKLHSTTDCQRIIKKAVAESLKAGHSTQILDETGAKFQIQFSIIKDIAGLYIDTSGDGLHKRGYRQVSCTAPIRETLAAAIVKLSRYKGREVVFDPFCGSGTILIEAALTAMNRAPGLSRTFVSQNWSVIDKAIWKEATDEAKSREYSSDYVLFGSDINPECIKTARENAKKAGVNKYIRFEQANAANINFRDLGKHSTIIMTNPPYGERVMDIRQAEELYQKFGINIRGQGLLINAKNQGQKSASDYGCKAYILSSHTEFEHFFGISATKRRKLYNGMIKCNLYMYY